MANHIYPLKSFKRIVFDGQFEQGIHNICEKRYNRSKPTRTTRLAMRNLFENSPKVSAVAVGCSKNYYYFCPINKLLYSKYADDKTNYR